MSGLSKQRTTCAITAHSRIFARNLLPSPSPWEAPFIKPAISTNFTAAGGFFLGLCLLARKSRRSSGKSTIPTFGSIVQNGKFSAAAGAAVKAEKIVDLPTFGKPTIPQSNDITSPYKLKN